MSYSIGAWGVTKVEVKEKLAAQFAQVLEGQPIHSADIEQAKAAANAFIDLLPNDPAKDIHVSVSGSVSWLGDLNMPNVVGASVNIGASLVPKP